MRTKLVRLKADEIVVKSTDHYFRGGLGYPTWLTTFKVEHASQKARADKMARLLSDMLLLDPSLARFRTSSSVPLRSDWLFDAVHEAAELLRSDASEESARAQLQTFTTVEAGEG